MAGQIIVRGARQHNLRNIDVTFPRDRLVVISGPSGSGKSSLAFDTIYAEAQRRYLESLSVHARQYLGRLPKPDVDLIEGLSPAIGVQLRELGKSPQSTVGTATEILDLLRLLFERVADQHCPQCGALIVVNSVAQMVDRVLALPAGERFSVRAPIARAQTGEQRATLERLRREGYVRVVVDGKLRELSGLVTLPGTKPHTLEVDIDRLAVKNEARSRLHDSLELGLRAGNGVVHVVNEHGAVLIMSERNACIACGTEPSELTRQSPAWNSLRIAENNLAELCALELETLQKFLLTIPWCGARAAIAEPILAEVQARLRVLLDLGIGYLSLARESGSLSRGEAERIRLAAQLGAGLCGVLYVLDEPTTGLHARDTERLLRTLIALRNRGNTVLVVEHDIDMIAAADHVIDLGPGAGPRGGRVMASGTPHEVSLVVDAPTAPYLAGNRTPIRRRPRKAIGTKLIRIRGAHLHNLVDVDVDIPINFLTCVSGVSGSGKSSLIMHTLLPAVRSHLRRESLTVAARIDGLESISRVVHVDQSPIGRSSRSNPATYAGAFTTIRELFAGLPEARTRGFDAKRFSFNLKGGRCEHCQGEGVVRVPMQFLPDVYVSCDVCAGSRFERETLAVRYRGYDIAAVLRCSVDEASELFGQFPKIAEALSGLRAVGLGYLQLGQSATTLSVGEAQRLRLGRELARHEGAPTLYLLDEPTAGLHLSEVKLLLDVLEGLIHAGHTVVVVEHNLELVRLADHVIDMGPEAGAAGGRVVVVGTPAEVAVCPQSHTGRYLGQRLRDAG